MCDAYLLLHTVTCDLPSQLLERSVIVDAESQVIPHMEGQFITYTCPPGFVLSGPNASICTRNGEWEPDPGQVDCIGDNADNGAISWTIIIHIIVIHAADCGVPIVDKNATLIYTSTLEGSKSVLLLICESDIISQTVIVTCHSSGNWIPDPAQFTCLGTEILIHSS